MGKDALLSLVHRQALGWGPSGFSFSKISTSLAASGSRAMQTAYKRSLVMLARLCSSTSVMHPLSRKGADLASHFTCKSSSQRIDPSKASSPDIL